MQQIQVNAKFTIHPGKLEEFKKVARRCLDAVNEKEKGGGGILQYDWFLTPDGSNCVVRETYADSDAVLAHIANVGPMLGELGEVSTVELELFGTPSEELQAATKDFPIRPYGYLQGLDG